jgi:hypothetical protein
MIFHQVVFFCRLDWAECCESTSNHDPSFDLTLVHSQFLDFHIDGVSQWREDSSTTGMGSWCVHRNNPFQRKINYHFESYNLSKRGDSLTDAKKLYEQNSLQQSPGKEQRLFLLFRYRISYWTVSLGCIVVLSISGTEQSSVRMESANRAKITG